MGDIILTTPLIRCLRRQFPDAEINYLLKKQYAPLLEHCPDLDNLLTVDTENGLTLSELIRTADPARYDAVIDLQGSIRSRVLTLLSRRAAVARFKHMRIRRLLLVKFGINLYRRIDPVPLRFLHAVSKWQVSDDGLGLQLYASPRADAYAAGMLASRGLAAGTPYAVLAPGAGRATKQWPAAAFLKAGQRLVSRGYRIVLTGSGGDMPVCSWLADRAGNDTFINLCGKLELMETFLLLKGAALLVTNDTGIMHMGCAAGIPVIAVFGPTSRELGFFPFRARAAAVETDIGCRPCSYHGTAVCPRGHFECMQNISAEEVVSASEKLIRQDSQ